MAFDLEVRTSSFLEKILEREHVDPCLELYVETDDRYSLPLPSDFVRSGVLHH